MAMRPHKLNFRLRQPKLLHFLELPNPLGNLDDLSWVEREHRVAKLQHPRPSLLAWVNFDALGVGDLNLSSAERTKGETIPLQMFDWDEVNFLDGHLRANDRVFDHQHHEEVGIVLVKAGEAVNGRQVRHVERRALTMRFHVHHAIVADLVLESEVGHRAAGETGGILADEVAENLGEVVFDD